MIPIKEEKEEAPLRQSYLLLDNEALTGVPPSLYKYADFNGLMKAINEDNDTFTLSVVLSGTTAIPDPIDNKKILLPNTPSIGTGAALGWHAEPRNGLYRNAANDYGWHYGAAQVWRVEQSNFYFSQLDSGSVLFLGTSGLLTQDNTNLSFNNATNILSAANVTVATNLTLSALTATRLIATDGSKVAAIVANLQSWIAGTANQIVTADDGDGTITLSTPQNIHTAATPTFAGLTLSGLTAGRVVVTDTGGLLAADAGLLYDIAADKMTLTGEIELDGALNHDGSTVGLYAATPVAQGTGGQNVTNNVTDSGSTAGTIPDITDGATYANDYTNLRRALYQLARMLKQDHDQLRAMGILT